MKDQVEALRVNGVETAFFNSSLSDSEKSIIQNKALNNELKLLYLSPETFVHGMSWIQSIPVSMIAVDEAHCVSMWGHDFRPEYQAIGDLRNYFPNVPFVGFTATADKITRKDISEKLKLQNPSTFISSFDRPNLSLSVKSQIPKKQKEKEIVNFIKQREGSSGIIYCLSRKETESWSNFLNTNGISSRYYHAGLNAEVRNQVQEGFINDNYNVICATIAFGMGIDKSNVRWVIHNNLPKNIEGYYQEIGRAGRDGVASDTLLYYNYRDVVLLNDFVQESEFKEVYLEKIKRILQYAEASTCRRKILLAYFGEHLVEDCGNCDICRNPPDFIDGKVIAQKALSASLRTKESVGINLLINVLRGAKTIEIFEKNLDKIKTYGVGSEYSFREWQHFINQLINQGVFEVAYDNKMRLNVTDFGHAILSGRDSIKLSEYVDKKESKQKKKKKSSAKNADENLLLKIKSWRKELAKKNSVPAYVIFNDATLNDIVHYQPQTLEELLNIQGMGKVKIERFGNEILEFIQNNTFTKQTTFDKTLSLYNDGRSLEEIAEIRELSQQTIVNHLIKLFEEGKKINLYQLISEFEVQQIKTAHKKLNNTFQLKPIHEELNGEIAYNKISIGLAILSKQQNG
jgi:ATP-dependent DNA helicase RecQ